MTYKSIYMIMTKEEYILDNTENLAGLIFPEVDLKTWSKIHDVEFQDVECNKCRKMLKPWFPFADKIDRGVIYHECNCCEEKKGNPPFKFWSADPKRREEDRLFAQSLYDHII